MLLQCDRRRITGDGHGIYFWQMLIYNPPTADYTEKTWDHNRAGLCTASCGLKYRWTITYQKQDSGTMIMATYFEFRELGDQWLIFYACAISRMPIPTLFTIGHCLEAYCKSAILKTDPKANVIQYGHDIESMISKIQQDSGLLTHVTLKPNVEKRFMTGRPIPFTNELMSDLEYIHYVENQELYWVSKFQKEIKYLGTNDRRMPTQFSLVVMERNPYWIPTLKELRGFLMENSNTSMYMDNFLKNSSIEYAVQYLRQICS